MSNQFLLNDGTYIYSEDTAKEYLISLGFDIDDLCEMLNSSLREREEELEYLLKTEESNNEANFEAFNNLVCELQNLLGDFRKKYKAKAVLNVLESIEKTIDFYTS